MNIAIILRRIDVRGGTQRLALELAKFLKRNGHIVTFYTLRFAPEKAHDEFTAFKVVVHTASGSTFLSRLGILGVFIQEARDAKVLAKRIDTSTEVLNPHDQVSYKVAAYAKRRLKHVPSVWTMNDMPTRKASFEREREVNPHLMRGLVKKIMHSIVDWFDIHLFIKPQDAIAVLDHRDQSWVKRDYGKHAEVIRTGVTIPVDQIRKRDHLKTPPRLLLFAHIQPHRRFEDVIHAVALLKKEHITTHLTIAGKESDAEYTRFIRLLVAEQGLEESVTFMTRSLEDKEVEALYAESDIFLNPSHFQSWGIAVFEALGRGVPVVVSNTVGASEVLTDGTNGLMVKAKDPTSIKDALKKLIQDKGVFQSLSSNGVEFVREHITWEIYGRHMLALFKKFHKSGK